MFEPLPPADPARFEEAAAEFRAKVPMLDDAWRLLSEAARLAAFKVAGVAQLRMVGEVQAALQKAIEDGETLADFKKRVGAKLRAEWRGTVANPAHRLETIFRTNVQTAYNQGTWRQIHHPETKRFRPYIKSSPILDFRTTVPICLKMGTVILPSDDPYWLTRWAPLHYSCRRSHTSLTERAAKRQGITKSPPNVAPMPGFGMAPPVAREWQPDLSDVPRSIVDAKPLPVPTPATPPLPVVTVPDVVPRKGWNRRKEYKVPVSELEDLPAIIWVQGRADEARRLFAEDKVPPPILVTEGPDGRREIVDGNHRLAVARELGVPTIPVRFLDRKAAEIRKNRPPGTSVFDKGETPMG